MLVFLAGTAPAAATSAAPQQGSGAAVEVLAAWTFEPAAPSGRITGSTFGPLAASTGQGALLGFHARGTTVWSHPAGNGSAASLSANNWANGDFFEITVDATGWQDLRLCWDQTRSAYGPAKFRVDSSHEGPSFTPVFPYEVPVESWNAGRVSESSSFATALPPLTSGGPLRIRLVSLQEGSSRQGTSRLDHVRLEGRRQQGTPAAGPANREEPPGKPVAATTPEPRPSPAQGEAVPEVFQIEVAGSPVKVTRLGHGPRWVVFFGHSGSAMMMKSLLEERTAFGDLLPDQCSFFFWAYPNAPPFHKVETTLAEYREQAAVGPPRTRLRLAGLAAAVLVQIKKETGLRSFLLVGNSLGAGIILWDYEQLAFDPQTSFLLISPTEVFMPPVTQLKPLRRSMLLAAKDDPARADAEGVDPFLQGKAVRRWVAENLSHDVLDHLTTAGLPEELRQGHLIIGRHLRPDLLGRLIRVQLGLATVESLAGGGGS